VYPLMASWFGDDGRTPVALARSGGFNNPDDKYTPRYAVITGWVVRGLLVVLVLFCILALGLYFFGSR
jgi:multidrug efflux pump subunit AcrB